MLLLLLSLLIFSVVRCVQSQIYYNIQFVCRFFFLCPFVRPFSPIPITLMMSPQCTIAPFLCVGSEWTRGCALCCLVVLESIFEPWFNEDAKKEAERRRRSLSLLKSVKYIDNMWKVVRAKPPIFRIRIHVFIGIENLLFALLTQAIFFISLWRLFTVHWIQWGLFFLFVWFDMNVATEEEDEEEGKKMKRRKEICEWYSQKGNWDCLVKQCRIKRNKRRCNFIRPNSFWYPKCSHARLVRKKRVEGEK